MFRSLFPRLVLVAMACTSILAFGSVAAEGQGRGGGFGGGGGGRTGDVLWGLPDLPSGFHVCRLMFTTVASDPSGSGWAIEYPRADINFMTRISELTTVRVAGWRDRRSGGIGHTVVRATDPELFRCPYLVMASPGTAGFDDQESEKLREYLLKGGFLWVDDFWGDQPWAHWEAEITRILPEFPIVELTPEHPIFAVVYRIPEFPQIPSLNRWSPGLPTSERPGAEYETPHLRAIFDDSGRLLVLMSHNTDIQDGFEREADLEAFFQLFAWRAYSFGVNVAMWNLTR